MGISHLGGVIQQSVTMVTSVRMTNGTKRHNGGLKKLVTHYIN